MLTHKDLTIRKLYSSFRNRLTPGCQGWLTKAVYALTDKPYIRKDKFQEVSGYPSKASGGLIISLDFEMAWAFRYSKRAVDPLVMAQAERTNIPLLLTLFSRFTIPVTWATVGHLFLESCKRGSHDWMRRIPYFDGHWRYTGGDWFDADPCSDFRNDSAWYAPDMIELILKSKIKHEFGCHTFSHIDCSDRHCPPGVLADEIKASFDAAAEWGIRMKAFVFPGGTAGNYQVLKDNGFQIYRKNLDYDLVYPFFDRYGMLVTASSLGFGRSYNWSAEYYIKMFCRYIDKAIKTNTAAHLWLHPSVDGWTLENVIPQVLKYAAEKRETGQLWIGTMGQIADIINSMADHNQRAEPQRKQQV